MTINLSFLLNDNYLLKLIWLLHMLTNKHNNLVQMAGRRSIFNVKPREIDEMLFGDTSDTEDALVLGEEDTGFLEEEAEALENNNSVNEDCTVITDPTDSHYIPGNQE